MNDANTYVQTLFTIAGVTPTAAETTAAINAFNGSGGGDAGRAAALRSVAESNSVSTKLFNEAFVLMQYFGYLQRNPNDPPDTDYSGYNFWLTKLNQFNGDYIAAEMVKAFISSSEYRSRFGPEATKSFVLFRVNSSIAAPTHVKINRHLFTKD